MQHDSRTSAVPLIGAHAAEPALESRFVVHRPVPPALPAAHRIRPTQPAVSFPATRYRPSASRPASHARSPPSETLQSLRWSHPAGISGFFQMTEGRQNTAGTHLWPPKPRLRQSNRPVVAAVPVGRFGCLLAVANRREQSRGVRIRRATVICWDAALQPERASSRRNSRRFAERYRRQQRGVNGS